MVDPATLNALHEEIKLLRLQIEQTGTPAGASAREDLQAYFAATNALLDTLPNRIAAAIGDALQNQHRMILKDVEATLRSFAGRPVNPTQPPR